MKNKNYFVIALIVCLGITLNAQKLDLEWNGTPEDLVRLIEGGKVRFAIAGESAGVPDKVSFKIKTEPSDDLIDVITFVETGRVGIGTKSPKAELHVNGDYYGKGHMFLHAFEGDGNTGTAYIQARDDSGTSDIGLKLRTQETGSIREAMAILPNGSVGIGTGNPTEKLHVNGNIRVVDDASIFGIDQIVGFNDLKFSADPVGGPDFRIGGPGYAGFGGGLFSNVALNIRNIPNNTGGQIVNVELDDGTNIFQIQADQDFFVIGDFYVNNGTKNFIIDHPLDPVNLSLAHNAIEAPGHFTYYHGTATIGPDSAVYVVLPEYFQALNSDTCVQNNKK